MDEATLHPATDLDTPGLDTEAGTQELAADLFVLLARLNRAGTRACRLPVPPAQARLLAQIDDLGRPRLGELAAADGCSQPTLSAQARRLEASGWVTRERDDQDGRAVRLTLTDSGRATLAVLRHARAANLAPYLAALTPSERTAVVAALPALHQLSATLDVGLMLAGDEG